MHLILATYTHIASISRCSFVFLRFIIFATVCCFLLRLCTCGLPSIRRIEREADPPSHMRSQSRAHRPALHLLSEKFLMSSAAAECAHPPPANRRRTPHLADRTDNTIIGHHVDDIINILTISKMSHIFQLLLRHLAGKQCKHQMNNLNLFLRTDYSLLFILLLVNYMTLKDIQSNMIYDILKIKFMLCKC